MLHVVANSSCELPYPCFVCREKILEYRVESQKLDQCSRLYDSSVSSDGFEHDAGHIVQVVPLISFQPLFNLLRFYF